MRVTCSLNEMLCFKVLHVYMTNLDESKRTPLYFDLYIIINYCLFWLTRQGRLNGLQAYIMQITTRFLLGKIHVQRTHDVYSRHQNKDT